MARQMKDSGIEWIGEIPEDWEVTKAKFILSANDGGVWGNDPADDGNNKIVIRSTEQTIDGKWCIEAPAIRDLSTLPHASSRILSGDLLITKSSGSDLHIGKTTLADEYFEANECYFSNFIQRIRCKDYLPRLLWYLFNSNIVREQFVYLQNTTSGIGNINADIIDNLFLPNPPLTMQKHIATFLDHKCAEIDAVIERTKATIEEYKKLKQAVITEAVTKGVRGNRPMKDSGIEWLGSIPDEWDCTKLKQVWISVNSGVSVNAADYPTENDAQYGVLKTSCVSKSVFLPNEHKQVDVDEYSRVACPVKKDSLIVSRMNTPDLVGACGYVDKDYPNLFLPDRLWQINFFPEIATKYVWYYLNSQWVREYISSLSTGTSSSMQNISKPQFGGITLAIPSFEEQQEIIAYLDEKCAELDTLIAKKTALLTELETYKKSLIYEYVTGKKYAI